MKSVISEIFDGEYGADNVVRSEKYKQLKRTADTVYNRFAETLNEKQQDMLEEVLDAFLELEAEQNRTGFTEGFKLGLLVAFEAVGE